MFKFSESTKRKLGNAIVYIAYHTSGLCRNKLLKLLYLMEEHMALKYHVPFIGMPYEVWQAGPVAKDVFIDLSDVPYILKGFVRTEFRDGGIFIEAIADFDDSEFSKCEIEIMDYVLVRYGAAVRTGLLETFNRQECNNSDLQINFAEVMSDSSAEVYCESLNIRQTANLLNVEFYV